MKIKNTIYFLTSFLFFTFAYGDMTNQQLMGQWKVQQWVTGALNTNISQQDVDNIIGKVLVINAQTVTLKASVLDPADRSCSIDNNESGWINSDPMFYFDNNYDWPVDASDITILGIKAPFWALSACIPVFTTKDPNQIVFIFGSTFFKAEKQENNL